MRIAGGCVLLGLLLVPRLAEAQAPAAAPPSPPKQEGTAEAAFVGVTGNASSSTIGLAGEFIARPDKWTIRQKASFVRNEASGAVTTMAVAYTPRAERAINARVSLFGEYNYFRDRFAGIANRNSVAGGVSLKLIVRKSQTLSFDAGAGYLNETRLTGPNVSSAVYLLGGAYKLKLSATADLSDDVGLVGDGSNTTDWRVTNSIAVTARVSKILSLKVGSTVRYAHAPVPGFKTTDTTTSIALVAKFASK